MAEETDIRAVLDELALKDQWRGKIFINLHPVQDDHEREAPRNGRVIEHAVVRADDGAVDAVGGL